MRAVEAWDRPAGRGRAGAHVRLRPAAEADAGLLAAWGAEPHASPWWQLGGGPGQVAAHLAAQLASDHLTPWVGEVGGRPVAYVETYVAALDPLARHYEARPGDRGWHILVGPPGELGTGRPRLVARAALAMLFDQGAERVVCEPDVRNERMVRFCRRLGHEQLAELDLPDKRAALLACTPAGFARRDVVGVGLGPFNLALAALLEPLADVEAELFDRRERFAWHPGLLLDGTTLQVPFLADLVTLADPTSPHSFLAYLHDHDRLLRFYLYERFHVPRREYDAYCRWVAGRLPSCRFGAEVVAVEPDGDGWAVTVEEGGSRRRVATRAVVLGVGSVPWLPPCARAAHGAGDGVVHSAAYLDHRDELVGAGVVAVVGSGQSAAEVVADLLARGGGGRGGPALRWFTRSRGFLPMEYSKLGLEHFSPDYARWFHGLGEARRDEVRAGQDLLYKGISASTSAQIYDALYEGSVDGPDLDVAYASGCELVSLERSPAPGRRWRLELAQRDDGGRFHVDADAVVLATGYEPAPLPLSPAAAELFERDGAGRFVVDLDHRLRRVDGRPSTVLVQNAELHTHGVGAPDLGLGARRAAAIANAVAGRAAYRLPDRTVFQTFGSPGSQASGGPGRG